MASPTQSITVRGNKHNACGVTKPSCCNGFTMTSSSSIMTMFTETWPREESINTTSTCSTSWLLNKNVAFLKISLISYSSCNERPWLFLIWKSRFLFLKVPKSISLTQKRWCRCSHYLLYLDQAVKTFIGFFKRYYSV